MLKYLVAEKSDEWIVMLQLFELKHFHCRGWCCMGILSSSNINASIAGSVRRLATLRMQRSLVDERSLRAGGASPVCRAFLAGL